MALLKNIKPQHSENLQKAKKEEILLKQKFQIR